MRIDEAKRNDLLNKSKSSQKGKQRFERRKKSRIENTVKAMNGINMDRLFKEDVLTIDIPVHGETDEYIVKVTYIGFLELLRKEVERTGVCTLREISKAAINAFNSNEVYISCSCLHPDTIICLIDNTFPTVAELKVRFDKGEHLYVYSMNEQHIVEPVEIEKVWVTKKNQTKFIEITLEDNTKIKTTPEHPFMLRNGDYILAKHIKKDMYLMSTLLPIKVLKAEKVKIDKCDVYDIKVKKNENFAINDGVIVHNCPDFIYRFNYWATQNKFNSDAPETRPPKITNPNDNLGSSCKHILLALSNNSWILRAARAINSYIKYMENHYQKLYADIIYPAIYGKEYEEPVQLSINGEDELPSDKGEVSKAIDYNQQRTRFQPGNQQGVQFTGNNDENQLELEDKVS